MADPIRFYLDAHIPRGVALGLRRRDIDVVRAQEAGLADASDDEHLRYAFRERRVLVTQDAGFISRTKRGEKNYGIAYCDQGALGIGEMIASLVLIHELLEPEEMIDRVEFL